MKKAILLSASLMLLSTAVFAQMPRIDEGKSAMAWDTFVAFTQPLPSGANVKVAGGKVTVSCEGVTTEPFDFTSCPENAQGAHLVMYIGAETGTEPVLNCGTEPAESAQ